MKKTLIGLALAGLCTLSLAGRVLPPGVPSTPGTKCGPLVFARIVPVNR